MLLIRTLLIDSADADRYRFPIVLSPRNFGPKTEQEIEADLAELPVKSLHDLISFRRQLTAGLSAANCAPDVRGEMAEELKN